MELTAAGLAAFAVTRVRKSKRTNRSWLAVVLPPKKGTEFNKRHALQSPWYLRCKKKVRQIGQHSKLLFSQETRRQQLSSLSPTSDSNPISMQEQELNKNLVILTAALGLTTFGTLLVYPLALLLGIGIYLYSIVPVLAADFYQAVVKERRVSIAVLEFFLISFMLGTGQFFAATLGGFLYVFSKKLIVKTEDNSRQSLINVFEQQNQSAWVKIGDNEVSTPVEQLQSGDIVIVHAGEVIPVDGVVQNGMASIDQHALTGEAQPVETEVGNAVYASTIVLSGHICIAVEKAGSETTSAQIQEILLTTADFKTTMHSRGVAISDRIALPTLGIGALSLLLGFPLTRTTALMNANFGYNMRVLAPIAMLNYLNHIAQQGILIKDGRALELLAKVDTIVFDKTGTLTQEEPHVGAIHTCGDYNEETVLTYAATAEYKQNHPIAKAILQSSADKGLSLFAVDDTEYQIGYGLTVTINDKIISVGSRRFMELQKIVLPPRLQTAQTESHRKGHSLVFVAINHQLVGALEMYTTVRAEAAEVLRKLRAHGIQSIYIISGDHEAPTQALANDLGIEHYFANVLPEHKAAHIKKLQEKGRTICYIGDGINDSIALKQAHVSISLSGASTIATDTASIILMDGSLTHLATLFSHTQSFEKNLRRSLLITILPGFISMTGVLFFNFGIITTMIWNQIGLAAGMANTLLSPTEESQKSLGD